MRRLVCSLFVLLLLSPLACNEDPPTSRLPDATGQDASLDTGSDTGVDTGVDTGDSDSGPTVECTVGGDCDSGVCDDSGSCVAASCGDGVQNQDETDIDCGGDTCEACAVDASCSEADDCVSGVCQQGTCAAADCEDGVRNGGETDVDCGGADSGCGGCENQKACAADGDCVSGVCDDSGEMPVCVKATCMDGVKNAGESDVDCGGPRCGDCAAGKTCDDGGDCASQVCSSGQCSAPTCADGQKNGKETDVDCGGAGSGCNACPAGGSCSADGDCVSGVCSGGSCQKPTCSDGGQNGRETDVDCGGNCSGCTAGKTCRADVDCASKNCKGGSCKAATCSDGIQNGRETDVDCGGSTCGGCGVGKRCTAGDDCAAGYCKSGTCSLAADCRELKKAGFNKDGTYTIDPDGSGGDKPFDAWCDMTTNGGGWTLVVISSDDNNQAWTWNKRAYFTTDTTTFGNVQSRNKDYKNIGLHDIAFEDMLFRHFPSKKWAAYHGVGSGKTSAAALMTNLGPVCYANRRGMPMAAGTIQKGGKLCDTDLYLNARDQDGTGRCGALSKSTQHAWGPTWSADQNDGCPMDDPSHVSGVGPDASTPGKEWSTNGFGWALRLNSYTNRSGNGSATSYLHMFVR